MTDAAQEDLALVISCIQAMPDSDRSDLLEACVEEFLRGLTHKVRLATSLAALCADSGKNTQSVPDSVHVGQAREHHFITKL